MEKYPNFKTCIIISSITLLILISSTATASQEYEHVNLVIIGKTDSMTIHGFHDSSSGYGNDSVIYIDFHGPYLDKGICKMWNSSSDKIFDDLLTFKRVTMYNFSGWMYFHPKFPILLGYCEYIRLSTLRGISDFQLVS